MSSAFFLFGFAIFCSTVLWPLMVLIEMVFDSPGTSRFPAWAAKMALAQLSLGIALICVGGSIEVLS